MSSSFDDFPTNLAAGYQSADADVHDGLLLAVSGGADSVALLHGTLSLWPDARDRIIVGHVNHALRGDASAEDAEFVEKTAELAGVRFECLKVAPGALQDDRSGSLEAAARDVRYQFLTETASRLQLAHVVTAHHSDDQAETVLHNILRGTGLRGMAGMSSRRSLTNGVVLVRPMLEVRSSAVHAYLTDIGKPHRTDHSNTDLSFTRNRIRRTLLPELREHYNSTVDRHIVSLARQTNEALRMLDAFAQRVLSDVLIEQAADVCRIDCSKLNEWPDDVRRHCLSLLWVQQDWPRKKMTSRHYEQLASVVEMATPPRGNLPGGVCFELTGQMLRLTRRVTKAIV